MIYSSRRLGDIAQCQLGKMLNGANQTGNHSLSYVRNINVQWGNVNLDELNQMDFDPEERQRYFLKTGDLLVCEGGDPGRAAIYDGPSDRYGYQNALHRVRARSGVTSNRFLAYALEYLYRDGQIAAVTSGSTIKHLSALKLQELMIPLPEAPTQSKIVKVMSSSDRYIASLKEQLNAHNVVKQGLLATEFSSRSTVPGYTATGTWGSYLEKRKPILNNTAPSLTLGTKAKGMRLASDQNGKLSTKTQLVNKGEFLFLRQGIAGGQVAVSTMAGRVSVNYPIFTLKDGIEAEYLRYLIQVPATLESFRLASSGTATPFLPESRFLQVKVGVHKETWQQREIVEIMHTCDASLKALSDELAAAEHLRSQLLADLFAPKPEDEEEVAIDGE